MVPPIITDDTFNSDQAALDYAAQLLEDLGGPSGTLPSRLRKIAESQAALLAACEAAAEWLSVFPSEGPEFEIATAEEVFSELTAAIAAARQE